MTKNKWVSFFLCLFLGVLGVHKFYEGRILLGILYLFTGGLFGVGVVVIWFVKFLFNISIPIPSKENLQVFRKRKQEEI